MRDGGRVAHIISAYPMRRSDKQADRVEIHPEQLSAAAMEAECLASKLERPIQVRWDPWSWSSATHFHAYTPPNTHSHTHNYPTQTPTHPHTHTHTHTHTHSKGAGLVPQSPSHHSLAVTCGCRHTGRLPAHGRQLHWTHLLLFQ